MKRYITIFGFFALFLLGSQFVSAQNQRAAVEAPEVIAKQKTLKLNQLVHLTGTQQGEVFKLLVDAEQNLQAINASGADATAIQDRKSQVLEYVNTKLGTILTPEQLKVYRQSLVDEVSNKAKKKS